VNNVSLNSISQTRLDEIRAATDRDDALQTLKRVILQGWPAHKSSVPATIAVYFDYRDELTVQDGILLRGERVVIPLPMCRELLQKVHAGHMGINSCLRRARELVFWPGMSAQIRQFIQSCPVCLTYSDKQQLETLCRHEIPHRPWQKVGTDLFEIKGRHYLVTVDYLSLFFEIDYLPDTTSQTVITKLKHHFARHGIPMLLSVMVVHSTLPMILPNSANSGHLDMISPLLATVKPIEQLKPQLKLLKA